MCADFDGTIVPIKPRPEQAYLDQPTRLLLRNISQNKRFSVGIISGRALKDLQQKITISNLIFAGNHGLEISYNKRNFVYPAAKKYMRAISTIARKLSQALGAFPETTLETKGLSLSLHYRLVKKEGLSSLKEKFFQIIQPYIQQKKIKLTYGKKVWELRPPIEWDKGKALLWLMQRLGRHLSLPKKTYLAESPPSRPKGILLIYLGDDATDEDAFRATNQLEGISIFVGRKKRSLARYRLKSTKDTRRLLQKISQMDSQCAR